MAKGKRIIHTSVDKLVALVEEKGRISFKEAAKQLAVPHSSIEEWAHFLEESEILEIDYKFMTPYLVKKQLSEKQKAKKVDAYKQDRQIFDKKLEAATSYFNELDKKIASINSMFKAMEGNLSSKLTEVDQEVASLAKAEKQKEHLDQQILDAKKSMFSKIKQIEDHLSGEKLAYNKSYEQAEQELVKDSEMLDKSMKFLDQVKNAESYLEKRLTEVKDMSAKIQDEVEKRSGMLNKAEEHINDVKKNHEILKSELKEEREMFRTLISENEEQEKMISKIQKDIMDKMEESEAKLTQKEKEIKDIPNRFHEMASRKNEIKDIINAITHEEIELKEHIEELHKSARLLKWTLGTKDYQKEMEKLNQQMDNITQKRAFFKNKVEQLIKLLDWKA